MAENQEPAGGAFRAAVFADFVCPYSYLAVDQMDRLAKEYGVRAPWRPHWLHPETPPDGTFCERTPSHEARRHAWFKEMAPDQYPRMRFPERRQYSFLAFEALEFAYERGLDFPFKTALYDLMWTEGGDIGKSETLITAGARTGLDPGELKVALDEGRYAERALEAVNQARRIGITNTPTIFLGRTRINGWTYYEVLQSVLEQQGVKPREAVAT
jgi:predicted DsbA family dithiol-disulfide isomerase